MMKEAAIQTSIIKALKAKYPDAMVWKQHAGRYAIAGMPDIFCLLKGRLYCLEVKRPGEKARPLQEAMMDKLAAAGAFVTVVHSKEEALEEVEKWTSQP